MTEETYEPPVMEDGRIWNGSGELLPFLQPVEHFEPFPGNPRRGDVEAIKESLKRFGQVKPVITDPVINGPGNPLRIVAHHHVRLAAIDLGWTHIAAMGNEFGSEEEARAFLIADNRIPERATYDQKDLHDQLAKLGEIGRLDGTGFSRDDLDAQMEKLRAQSVPALPKVGPRENRDPDMKQLVLDFNTNRYRQAEQWIGIIANEEGTEGTSETVYRALEIAARHLNRS